MDNNLSTVSLGYLNQDGDLVILATLNNNTRAMSQREFNVVIRSVLYNLTKFHPAHNIVAMDRQDADDKVMVLEDETILRENCL